MEIRPTTATPISTGAASSGAARPAADKQPEETFVSSNGGPVNLIIQHEDKQKLEGLKASILARNPNNQVTAELPLINGFAVQVTPGEDGTVLPDLTKVAGPGVAVTLDQKIGIPEGEMPEMIDTFRPLMDNANQTLGVDTLHAKGITGKGVTVCVIDTGIAQHPDIKDRIVGFQDMVNGKTEAYDDQGHGSHCAGIVAGSGKSSDGKFKGVAPEASLVGVKVLDANGSGTFSNVIKGIQWAVENKEKFSIDVISMSLGGPASKSYKDDPVSQAVEAANAAGITTVVAAGNEGPRGGTIGTPANAPSVVTVGALDDKGTLSRDDDGLAYFSSRGPTNVDKLTKPDVLAPGVNITSLSNKGNGYVSMSGTSMATPFTAGVAALMHQAKPSISPSQVKEVMMQNADKLPPANGKPLDENQQGKGVVDPVQNVEFLLGQQSPKP